MSSDRSIVVVGGGVIGLSLAWELSTRGHLVTVIDKWRLGKKASWAGAGIIVPSNSETARHPLERLLALGSDRHKNWAERLGELTGIDTGYRECGGIYVARTAGEKAALVGQKSFWKEYQIPFENVGLEKAAGVLQCLNFQPGAMVVRVAGESQICNPDHLSALMEACELNGVRLMEDCRKLIVGNEGDRVDSIQVGEESLDFDQVCFCAGAWSQEILELLSVKLPLVPVRGQMLLFKLDKKPFDFIVNEGSRYIVPRDDGHVLVGSTTEEVGFNESTTEEKLAELQEFATGLVPALKPETRIREWAGLRPATYDGFPYMGRINGFTNTFVSTGHFKSGLQTSSISAELIADMMDGKTTTEIDMHPFEPSRLDMNDSFVDAHLKTKKR